jgi:hypothetical protein
MVFCYNYHIFSVKTRPDADALAGGGVPCQMEKQDLLVSWSVPSMDLLDAGSLA